MSPTRPARATKTPAGPAPAHPLEFALGVVALLVLARSPALFLRLRTEVWAGGPIAPFWPDDTLLRAGFAAVEAVALVVVVARAKASSLRRHVLLLGLLGLCLMSAAWSVEPGVTAARAGLFAGTAAVGWFLGARFRPSQQAVVVMGAAAAGAALSLVAVVAWPELATVTVFDRRRAGLWSGVYVNRNLLGGAMMVGILAVPWACRRWSRPAWAAASVAVAAMGWLLVRSGSRTPLVAGAATIAVVGFVAVVRSTRRVGIGPRGGLALTVAAAGALTFAVASYSEPLLEALGRDSTLSSRTEMWEVDLDLISDRPWFGYGFEAVWANPPRVQAATQAWGAPALQAHNGYLEMLLGVGAAGLALFAAVVALTLWRAFSYAWDGHGLDSLWPLAVTAYTLVVNVSESFFIANDYHWALLVAAGVTAAQPRRRPGGLTGSAGPPRSPVRDR